MHGVLPNLHLPIHAPSVFQRILVGLQRKHESAMEPVRTVGPVLGVLSPVFIYDSIKMSNRFVGPMVSFRRSLKELASGGDPGKAQFRENDYWKEMACDFNTIANEMRDLRSAANASQSKDTDKPEPVQA